MFKSIKKYWRIFVHFRKIYLMTDFEYRGNFFFWALISVLWTGFNFFFMNIIATANNGIAGWSPIEIQLLISVYTMMDAFTWSIFYNNMSRYTERVFSGELNYFLTKPVNTQFMLMTERSDLSNLPRFLIGLVMTIISIQQLGISLHPAQIVLFVFLFVISLCTLYFSWFILSTLSFYVEKLTNINEIFPTVRRFFETPADIYTRLPLLLMSITIPFALLTNIPVNVLRNKVDTISILIFILVAVVMVVGSHLFFRYSVKKYAGVAN